MAWLHISQMCVGWEHGKIPDVLIYTDAQETQGAFEALRHVHCRIDTAGH